MKSHWKFVQECEVGLGITAVMNFLIQDSMNYGLGFVIFAGQKNKMVLWIILVDLLCAVSAYVASSEKEVLYKGREFYMKERKRRSKLWWMFHHTISRKLHRQRVHKPMGRPWGLCWLLEQRGLRAPRRNVQLVRGLEAGSLRSQLEREEGLLPLPEPLGQLERGLRWLLCRSPLRDALGHLG